MHAHAHARTHHRQATQTRAHTRDDICRRVVPLQQLLLINVERADEFSRWLQSTDYEAAAATSSSPPLLLPRFSHPPPLLLIPSFPLASALPYSSFSSSSPPLFSRASFLLSVVLSFLSPRLYEAPLGCSGPPSPFICTHARAPTLMAAIWALAGPSGGSGSDHQWIRVSGWFDSLPSVDGAADLIIQ